MLDRGRFTRVGANGIGNPRSQVAQSMSFFDGHLYLGVTHPKGEDAGDAARILRYEPDKEGWSTVYESPLVQADENAVVRDVYRGEMSQSLGRLKDDTALVPRYRGYRCMAQFENRNAKGGSLFVSTLSHWGSQLLRTDDGEHFEVASEPGLGNDSVLSFRTMLTFNRKLFVAPVGTVSGGVMDRNFGDIALLYVSDDPAGGRWELAMEPGFGDPTNKSVFSMAVFNGHLYAGTGNPERGFEVWKTRARGKPPFKWTRVITQGAGRYNLNEVATTMAAFGDAVYVGSGIPGLGYDKAHDVGPAAAELIRIDADDRWELIVGSPRFSPNGLKLPLSLQEPGFDDPENSALWAMAEHDGVLYVGTHHCGSFKKALAGRPELDGGFQLWASADCEDWTAITLDGFGDPYATGVRTLVSTPQGLFLGTSTHREIEKFWKFRTGAAGPPGEGGLEVWLGR
jgi:hypothetical protein